MTPPPLAIVQARMDSTRLKNKMLLPLGGQPLVWWAWNAAVQAFGAEHVVVAIPGSDAGTDLLTVLHRIGARVFAWDAGTERDVLGRLAACARAYRWHPDAVIVRVTPDDPFKSPAMMRRVASGERLPVELGAEAFTLGMLEDADEHEDAPLFREHVTWSIFGTNPPPKAPPGIWTVDTQEDYERACERVNMERAMEASTALVTAVTRSAMHEINRALGPDFQYGETLSENAGG